MSFCPVYTHPGSSPTRTAAAQWPLTTLGVDSSILCYVRGLIVNSFFRLPYASAVRLNLRFDVTVSCTVIEQFSQVFSATDMIPIFDERSRLRMHQKAPCSDVVSITAENIPCSTSIAIVISSQQPRDRLKRYHESERRCIAIAKIKETRCMIIEAEYEAKRLAPSRQLRQR